MGWSLFQLWIASPLPFMFGFGVLDSTETRSIHLAFALFLAFMAYPMLKSSPRSYVPIYDWVLGLAGTFFALYGYFFYERRTSELIFRRLPRITFAPLEANIFLFTEKNVWVESRQGRGMATL